MGQVLQIIIWRSIGDHNNWPEPPFVSFEVASSNSVGIVHVKLYKRGVHDSHNISGDSHANVMTNQRPRKDDVELLDVPYT